MQKKNRSDIRDDISEVCGNPGNVTKARSWAMAYSNWTLKGTVALSTDGKFLSKEKVCEWLTEHLPEAKVATLREAAIETLQTQEDRISKIPVPGVLINRLWEFRNEDILTFRRLVLEAFPDSLLVHFCTPKGEPRDAVDVLWALGHYPRQPSRLMRKLTLGTGLVTIAAFLLYVNRGVTKSVREELVNVLETGIDRGKQTDDPDLKELAVVVEKKLTVLDQLPQFGKYVVLLLASGVAFLSLLPRYRRWRLTRALIQRLGLGRDVDVIASLVASEPGRGQEWTQFKIIPIMRGHGATREQIATFEKAWLTDVEKTLGLLLREGLDAFK